MHAHELMTTKVVAVGPDEPTRRIAQLLLDNGISAVPVVDSDGTPIGMVSEGDLIGRGERERVARRDWWLTLLSGRQTPDTDFQARLTAPDRTARDVMAAPLVTVTEDTDAGEVARLLASYHIKRVPVVREGRLVGIVSRADLLRAVAATPPREAANAPKPHGFLLSLFGDYHRPAWEAEPVPGQTEARPRPDASALAAADFRQLVEDHQHDAAHRRDDAREQAAKQRRQRAKELIDTHVFDPAWRQLLHRARATAEAGEKESLLLRFPSQLCIDGGRAINIAETAWPASLRGEAAEMYLRWERDLKPRGFTLTAQVVDFPDGKPGDIGLFLGW